MSEKDIIVVPGYSEDAAIVYEYLVKHWNYHYPDPPSKDWRVTEELLKETIEKDVDFPNLLGVLHAKDELTGQVLGQVIYNKRMDLDHGKIIYMVQIYVDEDYRGHKIGYKLMKEMAKVAAAKDCILTWRALHWNIDTHKFYESIDAIKVDHIVSPSGDDLIQFFLFKEAIKVLAESEN